MTNNPTKALDAFTKQELAKAGNAYYAGLIETNSKDEAARRIKSVNEEIYQLITEATMYQKGHAVDGTRVPVTDRQRLANSVRSSVTQRASRMDPNRKPRGKNRAKAPTKTANNNGAIAATDTRSIATCMRNALEAFGRIPQDEMIAELTTRTVQAVAKARELIEKEWILTASEYGWDGKPRPKPSEQDMEAIKKLLNERNQIDSKLTNLLERFSIK